MIRRIQNHWTCGTALGILAYWVVALTPVIIGTFALVHTVRVVTDVSKSISISYTQAQSAPTAAIMADRLDQVLANIKAKGLDTGHSYGFTNNTGNDQARAYADITAYRDRARALSVASPTSADLATNLADMRVGLANAGVSWAPGAFWGATSSWIFLLMIPFTAFMAVFAYYWVYRPVDYWETNRQANQRSKVPKGANKI
jgi:hypothetical protein